MRLQGKVAIVTGAARGIGAECARRFVSEGAFVLLTDSDSEAGAAKAGELGEKARFIRHDVGDEQDWIAVVAAAERAFGPVAILVNNAGILGPAAATDLLTSADYERICRVNQTSVFLGCKYVVPSMRNGGGGAIVNISSIAGLRALPRTPNVAYVASKFAVRGMTKQVAVEFAADGIRANSIHPGFTRTSMMTGSLDDRQIDAIGEGIPAGRVGEVTDIADLVVFLASDESRYITGSEIVIDGGLTAQ